MNLKMSDFIIGQIFKNVKKTAIKLIFEPQGETMVFSDTKASSEKEQSWSQNELRAATS